MLRNGIECIYEVYKEKNFSRAAEKMYISQPALSAAIQKEEVYWGCKFFERSKIPVELTPEGEYIIDAIKRIKEIQTDVESYFEKISVGRRTSLNIGAPAFFCTYILPSIVKSFKDIYPDCKINVIEANDKDLLNGIQSEVIDCCISVERGSSNMTLATLTEESILLAVPEEYEVNAHIKGYQLNSTSLETKWRVREDCPKVSISEFSNYPFLLLNKGNDIQDRARKIFKESKINPITYMTLEQMATSFHMARCGMGIAFVRAGFMRYESNDLCFYAINSEYASRKVNVIKKNRGSSSILDAFILHLQDNFECI